MANRNINMQDKILKFIKEHVKENGYPPSMREIGEAVGLKSPSTVHGYLERMAKDGRLKKDKTKTRALELTPTYENLMEQHIEVPVIGTVAAGMPILAEENIAYMFSLPALFAKRGEVFMLRVKGDSMINAGILNDDYVIVAKQQNANDGEIVVALLDNEATVKRFYREDGMIKLKAENDRFAPIYSEDVVIAGKVVGVLRTSV